MTQDHQKHGALSQPGNPEKARDRSPAEGAARVPKRQRGKERVATLLAAAAAVFVDKGFEAATMTEVAFVAGAAIGSLYQFFPSKEHLAEALRRQCVDALCETLHEFAGRVALWDAPEIATRLFQTLLDFHAGHPVLAVLAEIRRPPPAVVHDIRIRLRTAIADILSLKRPDLSRPQAQAIAGAILLVMKTAGTLRAEPDPQMRHAMLDELRMMFRCYLETRIDCSALNDLRQSDAGIDNRV
ncbi:MAG: TetR/AcrR family transcriptional regulator [Azospirillaceae bacterium]|nr:TetR/AcrR family transcriptional regulator [Azospirillaceae bacterium]